MSWLQRALIVMTVAVLRPAMADDPDSSSPDPKGLSPVMAPSDALPGSSVSVQNDQELSLIHISEPTRPRLVSRMPSSA